jgi:Flp pilus assembly protein TadG
MQIGSSKKSSVTKWRGVPRLLAETDGSAVVELSLFAPMLVLMAIGSMNIGFGFYYWLQLKNAAQAGAQYAIEYTIENGYSASSINSAVASANSTTLSTIFSSASSTTTRYCGCPSGTGLTLAAWTTSCAAGTACSDGSTPGTYVQVVVSGTFTTLASYVPLGASWSFPASWPLSATATVRIQ